MKTLSHILIGTICALALPAFMRSLYLQWDALSDLSGNRFFFVGGALLWAIFWFVFANSSRLRFAYGLQHEFNHYLWIELMGGQSRTLEMGRRGGMVRYIYPYSWGRELIELSPYFFPLFVLPLLGIKLMVQPPYEPLVCFLLGAAWSWFYLDLGYVLKEHFSTTPQSDLTHSGALLCALILPAMNLFFTGLVWCGLADDTSIRRFLIEGPLWLYHNALQLVGS